MRRIFVDAAYYIGLLLEEDDLHQSAARVGLAVDSVPQVTTDSVLVEVLAYMSSRGARARLSGARLIDRVRIDPRVTLIHQDEDLFFAGLDLYRARLDKGYSLTDCMSMIVCREQDITDILTHDRHFEQEGFAPLL